jgi:transcription elongation factor Elf1
MRQQGQAMDVVVNQLQSAAQQLPREERARLGELVTDWEDKYGKTPHLSPVIGHTMGSSATSGVRATQTIPAAELSQPSFLCPRCNRSNPASSTVCMACGQPLQTALNQMPPLSAPPSAQPKAEMISPDSSLVQSLFTLYIRMRRQGQPMDDVVNKLQDSAQQLNREDRHQLGEIVTEWEDKFGRYLQVPQVTQPASMVAPPAPPQPPPPRPANHRAFGTRMLDQSQIEALVRQPAPAVAPSPVICPNCSRVNPVGSLICQDCGQSIQTKPVQATRRLEDSAPKKSTLMADFFSQDAALLIAIRGNKSVLEAFPRERLVIGRGASKVRGQPFLDLTPYDGEAMGVSRNHAEIRFVNNTLVVTDLESDNGTYINEVRLYPHEIRVLHNNDVLRVGKLDMKLSFRLPVRS